jgi:DNA polymerase IIIc chi subunit
VNDEPKKATHEQLLNGEVYTTSIINEPVMDFVVDFVVEEQSALEVARRRWFKSREEHERE